MECETDLCWKPSNALAHVRLTVVVFFSQEHILFNSRWPPKEISILFAAFAALVVCMGSEFVQARCKRELRSAPKTSAVHRNRFLKNTYCGTPLKSEAREIRTPNLLIWSQTRCRCAMPPMLTFQFLDMSVTKK